MPNDGRFCSLRVATGLRLIWISSET
jgi:hypothetical protein